MKEKLSVAQMMPYLKEASCAQHIEIHQSLASTNTYAKDLIKQGLKDGFSVFAETQTAGRGRMGRSFFSPAFTGIYLSQVMFLHLPVEETVAVTSAAAVAVSRAMEKAAGINTQIKWVNDLFFQEKKVCGILTEMVGNAVIVGVGVNCTTAFSGELSTLAGSLASENEAFSRNRLAAELVNELFHIEVLLKEKSWQEEYRQKSMVLGKEVKILQEENSRYLAEDIGDRGELMLKDEKGNRRVLRSGEITIRLHEN